MAKQSFSVGQVLTAAQMTSLQQTAMLGGSATAKTTSYTLVAADAGTVVSVNSTSATTITVNTGLFSAGDTVTIQNWGSGAVTITAGTATVNTAGSLIVPQYDGGVLYFTSASAAIYFDFVQAGAVSPLTTKGDLYGFGSSDARIPIGANGTILTADSTESLGLKWAAAASGGGMTLINTPSGTTLTGSSVTIGSIPATYNYLILIIENFLPAVDATGIHMRFNSDSNTRYRTTTDGDVSDLAFNENLMYIVVNTDNSSAQGISISSIYGYANSTTWKYCTTESIGNNATNTSNVNFRRWRNVYNQTSAITSLTLTPDSGNYTSGTAYLYGVK